MPPGPLLTLTGKTSAWQQRLCRDPRGEKHKHVSQAAVQSIAAAWLHHRTFGTVGVYFPEAPEPVALRLRRGQWLKVSGVVRPLQVGALRDDPRSVIAPAAAPLLLAVTELAILEQSPEQWPDLPQTPSPQRVRVGSPRQLSGGLVADVLPHGDLLHWTPHGTPQERFRDWNCVYGLVTRLSDRRFLRYVLSYRPFREGANHG